MNFKQFLIEQMHPFKYAYPLSDPRDQKVISQIYQWTMSKFGATAPEPQIWIVGHEHMQHAAQRADHFTSLAGIVYGWYSQKYPDKIFINDSIKPSRNRKHAALLIHEMVHYLQDRSSKYDERKPFGPDDVQFLEDEADQIMNDFISPR